MTAPLSLLYVDDDPDIRTIVEMALGLDPSFTVRAVASGSDAVALLGDGEWRPDVLLLDVMMPEMDGLATLAALRALPGMADTPVLFMTAKGREADVAQYLAHGAAGVILKPFDPLQLSAEIRALVGRP
ncbi:MAG: response regulator [Sphingomonas sp.]|uniref:response regulator n=1 Tax=Sphingomonas sp. TaxID=28214 RepID=UPI001ACAA712|nr:response regulator [Sphingomonas sp.]MBN8809328.1 response regulator [Sphingomonas sp.]